MIRAAKLVLLGIVTAASLAGVAAPAAAADATAAAPTMITVDPADLPVRAQTDGCVQTIVDRNGRTIYGISVINVCTNVVMINADGHAFNGPAGIDRRSGRANLGYGQGFYFPINSVVAPAGSLTCGELWGPNAFLWGRDCITM